MGDLPKKAWIFYQRSEAYPHAIVEVEPNDGEDFTLEELQGFVEGPIEKLPIPGHIIFANEMSGLSDEFHTNARFVTYFQKLLFTNAFDWSPRFLMSKKLIAGNVIVMDTPALREEEDIMHYIDLVAVEA